MADGPVCITCALHKRPRRLTPATREVRTKEGGSFCYCEKHAPPYATPISR